MKNPLIQIAIVAGIIAAYTVSVIVIINKSEKEMAKIMEKAFNDPDSFKD